MVNMTVASNNLQSALTSTLVTHNMRLPVSLFLRHLTLFQTYSNCTCLPLGEKVTVGLCDMERCDAYLGFTVFVGLQSLISAVVILGQVLLSLRYGCLDQH